MELTSSKIQDIHNRYWSGVLNIIQSSEQEASPVSLESLWRRIAREELQRGNFKKYYDTIGNLFDIEVVDQGRSPSYSSSFSKFCKDKQSLILEKIPLSSDHIYDFGSGWGRNAVLIAQKFPDKKVYALEYSQAGVECCQRLKEIYSLNNLEAARFDFNDTATLLSVPFPPAGSSLNAFCITSHSIEQVRELKIEFFDCILNTGYSDLSFFHIEPVGWQWSGASAPRIPAHYNRNLIEILRSLASQGRIQITNLDLDCYGTHWNPGSIIEWRRIES